MSGLLVVAPGLSTTVQDLGRRGFRHVGVPDSGAADPLAMRLANLLVGNAPDVGVLEAFYVGPTLRVETESARFAVVGPHGVVETRAAGAQAWVATPLGRSVRLEKGGLLRCRTGGRSAGLAIAVEGGFAIAPALGSVATLARGATATACDTSCVSASASMTRGSYCRKSERKVGTIARTPAIVRLSSSRARLRTCALRVRSTTAPNSTTRPVSPRCLTA